MVVLAVLVDRADHSDLRVALQRLLQNSRQFRVSVVDVALELLAQLGEHIAQSQQALIDVVHLSHAGASALVATLCYSLGACQVNEVYLRSVDDLP